MSIMMVTSLNTYTKGMEMKMKWQKKQAEGDYAPDGSKAADNTFQEKLDEIRYPKEDRSSQMEADIELKLNAGKRLTQEEMQYLKKHNPETYQKAKNIEREREAYEKELASCKTKEEVERVKAAHAAVAVDRVNAIKNNPHISSGKKLELIKMEHFKAAALDDAMHIFTKSSDYKELPTEAERQKAAKDMEEAREAELGIDEESRKEKAQEEKEAEEKAAEYRFDSEKPDGEKTDTEKTDLLKPITLPKKPSLPADSGDDAGEEGTILKAILDEEARWAKEEKDPDAASRQMTRTQAQLTPEARKVRHAKARAAYAASQFSMEYSDTPAIDIKK